MKVLLRKDVRGLGRQMETKEVSDGYARNYLIPKGLAAPLTEAALKAQQTVTEHTALHEVGIQQVAKHLKDLVLHFTVKTGSKGEVFGSVLPRDVENALRKEGIEGVSVVEPKHLKALGEHEVTLHLGSGVRKTVKIILEPNT